MDGVRGSSHPCSRVRKGYLEQLEQLCREDIEEILNFKDKGNANLVGVVQHSRNGPSSSPCPVFVFVVSAQSTSGFDVSTHCTQAAGSI